MDMKKTFLFCFLVQLVFIPAATARTGPVKLAFWNVENLFDLVDDPRTRDNDYLIGGKKNVTRESYGLKLENLSEVIDQISPDILGLCEVENRFMLEELNQATKRDYTIIHYESPDRRGIDVGLMYNRQRLKVVESSPITVNLPTGNPTRDILYFHCRKDGVSLHVYVNHWPSKYGGIKKTIPLRAAAASTLRSHVAAILADDPAAEIVVMGDLNDEPDEASVAEHLGATLDLELVGKDGHILWNVMEPWHKNPQGSTYMYAGKHMVYDHLIISLGLTDEQGLMLVENSVGVFDGDKYRQHDGKYDGYPFRFWAGNRVLGGYSDHMPVYLSIE